MTARAGEGGLRRTALQRADWTMGAIDRMQVGELTDEDLLRLRRQVRAALDSGEPLTESVRRYGIRDPDTLELWLRKIEGLIERRGLQEGS